MRAMKRHCAWVLACALAPCAAPASDAGRSPEALLAAYRDVLAGIDNGMLVWKDGTRMRLDDGKGSKSLEAMLVDPDIEDMFAQAYPIGKAGTPPRYQHDPGRVRYQPLFDKMYGNCQQGGVRPNLVTVEWLPKHGGGKVLFSAVNGAARQLSKVSAELDRLPKHLIAYLTPSAGTYNCRVIAGTGRLSMHAYGIAIDINLQHANYWRWTKPDAQGRYPYKNRIPHEIVRIFERHGFIWGGKWYHYDTMHFEYRPELLWRGG